MRFLSFFLFETFNTARTVNTYFLLTPTFLFDFTFADSFPRFSPIRLPFFVPSVVSFGPLDQGHVASLVRDSPQIISRVLPLEQYDSPDPCAWQCLSYFILHGGDIYCLIF